jgi:hypothetical protein
VARYVPRMAVARTGAGTMPDFYGLHTARPAAAAVTKSRAATLAGSGASPRGESVRAVRHYFCGPSSVEPDAAGSPVPGNDGG